MATITKNPKTAPAKTMPVQRATLTLGKRLTRTGTPVAFKQFYQTMTEPTKQLLSTLEKKFGIKWAQTAYDNTLPAKAKSGPGHSFVFAGKIGKREVFYDRFQFVFFVKNGFPSQRAKIHQVADMTKAQFEKTFLASAKA